LPDCLSALLPYPGSSWTQSQHNAGNSPWIPRVSVLELLTPGRVALQLYEASYAPQQAVRSTLEHQRLTMKFGKRLASEALRRHTDHYFDYKAIKKAIKDDIDSTGTSTVRLHRCCDGLK
ncbi:CTD small phosphatase, partial [Haematococcus lacustris]